MLLLVAIENAYIVLTGVTAVSCKYTQSSLVYANTPNQPIQAPVIIQPHSDGACNKLAYSLLLELIYGACMYTATIWPHPLLLPSCLWVFFNCLFFVLGKSPFLILCTSRALYCKELGGLIREVRWSGDFVHVGMQPLLAWISWSLCKQWLPLKTALSFILASLRSKALHVWEVREFMANFFFFHQTHYHAVSSCEGDENKTDNHVGITQELNSTGKLTYIAGNVWFYALGARTCFSAAW